MEIKKKTKVTKKGIVSDPKAILDMLPDEVTDRKFRIRMFGFRKRMLLYFSTFSIFFGIYVAAFLTGNSAVGDAIDSFASGMVTVFIVPVLSFFATVIPSTTISSLITACIGFVQAEFVRVVAGDLVFSILLSTFIVLVMIVVKSKLNYEKRQSSIELEPSLAERVSKRQKKGNA